MPRRKRLSKPTPKMIDVAIRTAAELTAAENPPHVRARAAATLLAREPDDEADPKGNPEDSPGVCVILPANGREHESAVFGWNPGAPVMFFRDADEKASIERGLASPLLLPWPASAA